MTRWLLIVLVCGACGSDPMPGASDGGADGPSPDATTLDADPNGLPVAGFGTLSGDCDELDVELGSPSPSSFHSSIDFAAGWTPADLDMLSAGGQTIYLDDNAGGSSLLSEVFAFELLARCELAALVKTETEIAYDTVGALTDFSTTIDGTPIGVSVTRAVGFPFDAPYTVADATALLEDKLADILESSANVSAADRWSKQILTVVAYAPQHAGSIETALATIDPSTVADTIVWVLVTNGADDFIYCDGPCS